MTCIAESVLVPLKEIVCRWCGIHFYVCRSCWRGRRYCSDRCREKAAQESHRESQRRYRRTAKGRENHREREKLRRVGLSKESKEIVDDASNRRWYRRRKIEYGDLEDSIKEDAQRLGYQICRCHVCGCRGGVVQRFARRVRGRRPVRWKWEDARYGEKA